MDFITKLMRNDILKEITGNIGKIEIKDDEVYCYVDGNKLVKTPSVIIADDLMLKYDKDTLIRCDLYDKRIHYIFSDMHFTMPLIINVYGDSEIIFESCEFYNALILNHADTVVLRNNIYNNYCNYSFSDASILGDFDFYVSKEVNAVKFSGNFVSENPYKNGERLRFYLHAKENIFDDVYFAIPSAEINGSKIIFDYSRGYIGELTIDADKINWVGDTNDITVGSAIVDDKGNDYVVIRDIDFLDTMIFNGTEIDKNMELFTEEDFELQKNRMILLDTLRNVYGKCQMNISDNLTKVQDNMNKQSIKRILKK